MSEHPMRSVGRRLELVRKRRGWTYREMAAHAAVPVNTLHRWVHRRRRGWEYYELRGLVERLGEPWDAQWERLWRQAAEPDPAPPPGGVPARAAASPPFQLPGDTAYFTGRSAELARLLDCWPPGDAPATVVVCAIEGMAGTGKTAMAVHAAHRLAGRFGDGVLFVDLHGFTPDTEHTSPASALETLLRALGVPDAQVPSGVDARTALYRTVLAGKRVLVVADNAATEAQVRPLLPATPGTMVLVTSRRRLAGLDEADHIRLDTLPPAEAVALFNRVAGERAADDIEVVGQITELCGLLPLAIRIAAARFRVSPTLTLSALLADLRRHVEHHQALAGFDDGDRSLAGAFAVSYRRLTADLRRAFRLLGLHPGVDVEPHAMAALGATSVVRARALLSSLDQVNLVDQHRPGRYTVHDLVRAFAAATAGEEESDAERAAARDRLARFYAATSSAAMDLVYPYDTGRRPHPPVSHPPIPDFADRGQAEAWLDTELDNLLAAPARTVHLSATLHQHLRTRGRYIDAQALHRRALERARAAGDRAGEQRSLCGLGHVHHLLGQYADAAGCFAPALDAARETHDRVGEQEALRGLGSVHVVQGHYEQATQRFEEALALARAGDDPVGEQEALRGLGHVHHLLGRYAQAVDCFDRALALARESGNRMGEQEPLRCLGHIHHMQGRYGLAAECGRQVLALARETGNRMGELEALRCLGHVHYLQGEYGQAVDCCTQALALARATGNRACEQWALRGLGHNHYLRGEYRQAIGCYEATMAIARETGNRTGEQWALRGLGHVHHRQGRHETATGCFERALAIGRETGNRTWQFEAHQGLGRVHCDAGRHGAAAEHHRAALDLALDLDQPADQARAHDGLAHACRARGELDRARHHWRAALRILTTVGVRHTDEAGLTAAAVRANLGGCTTGAARRVRAGRAPAEPAVTS